MIQITYRGMILFITCLWVLVRCLNWRQNRKISVKRELELILVYICLIVVARFTFFPFSKVNGQVQPLVFDASRAFPPRVNLVPIVYLFDYEIRREALINFIGNTAMFIPIGIIWPSVFRKLDTPARVITAGVCFSLFIEILQLPFYDRVTDVDDLLLNSLGYLLGYGTLRLASSIFRLISKKQ